MCPLLWNLVVDGILAWHSKEGLHTQGYADNLALLITGKFPSTVSDLIQWSLNIVQSLSRDNPNKTELVLFTKSKKWMGLQNLFY